MMVTTQLSGVSNPFSLRLASDVLFGIVLCFYFVCLVEIEQKEVRARMALEFEGSSVLDCKAVSRIQTFIQDGKVSRDHVHPLTVPLRRSVRKAFPGIEFAEVNVRVRPNLQSPVARFACKQER